jgi:hypothetical protein
MKLERLHSETGKGSPCEQAQAKLVALAVLFLVLGFAAGAWWLRHSIAPSSPGADASVVPIANAPAPLSETTISIIKRLNGPMELRYYSLLDPNSASDSLKSFAHYLDELLTEYQDASNAKLTVVRRVSLADDSSTAARDGLIAFDLDKGAGCFLGVALTLGTNHDALPRLSPEWAPAAEADISRAIAQLIDASQAGNAAPVANVLENTTAVAAVRSAIPDLTSTTIDDGVRLLRSRALQDYASAAADMDAQMKDAQAKLAQAKAGGSEADQQAAMKNLQDIQAAQGAKLRDIAAESQAEIDVFKKMKQTAP